MKAYISFDIIKEIMANFNLKKEYDIEYIIKLHIIEYGYNNKFYDDILSEYKNEIKKIPSVLGTYAATINSDNLLAELKNLPKQYYEPFLDFVAKYKIYERIPWQIFKQICDDNICMFRIFEYPAIVLLYNKELLKLIENKNGLIELLIQNQFKANEMNSKKLYFPSTLSPDEKEKLVQKYINSENVNLNYLKLIFNSRGTKEFPLSDQTRLLAKQKYKEKLKTFRSKSSVTYECEVVFTSIPNHEIIKEHNGKILRIEYSQEWINENLDYPTLLNNFLYLFEYCDMQGRMNFVSLRTEASVIEPLLGLRGKNDYFTSVTFNIKNSLHLLQMQGYCTELEKRGIDIQDIFKWFFEEYLKNEFHVNGFVYITPSKDTTYLEKCILLSCTIDSVLKQFDMFCLNGCIDRDLFEISSNHVVFQNLKGMIDKKYAYLESDNIKKEANLIFSDQSHLGYINKKEGSFSNLYSWIENDNLKLSDFLEYQTEAIKWLIDRGVILCDESEVLRFNNDRITILKNLFYSSVVSCSYFGQYKNTLDQMVASGDVVIESTLFSRQEQEYLDFILNNSKFGNGPALRNNYVHGTHSLDPKVHERDYYELLKIMTMIIIKINQEFCIKYPEIN